ncbi:hypothetical protein ALC60_11916 [Trachymyrmex zeteki]|uniref:Uncharacterized protein n=1 Tax=Mycetomoellerius zeteki TaxID=64791 RepID=A0A151WLW9_9HYME|nr:hypothetical protein ALC60_11916 [Trachymyrmex zeteki]
MGCTRYRPRCTGEKTKKREAAVETSAETSSMQKNETGKAPLKRYFQFHVALRGSKQRVSTGIHIPKQIQQAAVCAGLCTFFRLIERGRTLEWLTTRGDYPLANPLDIILDILLS